MTQLKIGTNSGFSLNATVRESDEYSEKAYVKFERQYIPEGINGCNEFFLTPDELEDLGNFLAEQAIQIRKAQALRNLTKRVRQDPRQG